MTYKKQTKFKRKGSSFYNNEYSNIDNNNNYSPINSKMTSKGLKFTDNNKLSFVHQINKINHSTLKTEKNNYIKSTLKNDMNLNIKEYLKTEADDMEYDDAIRKDKRKFTEYFSDKLKSEQIFLNTFFIEDPLKPKPIKIIFFILDIDLYLFLI